MKSYYYSLLLILIYGTTVAHAQVTGGYRGIPWGSPFPVIEKRFPEVQFVEEDAFHTVIFRVEHPEQGIDRIEFKLFEEQFIAAIQYYREVIDLHLNDAYVNGIVSGLGPRLAERKTTSPSLAGVADVVIWEYKNNLILFRTYPPGQKKGFAKKENSIVFIYKPLFDKMVYHRKHSEGDDDEEVVDYDYIDF